jgi:hypothetical protein
MDKCIAPSAPNAMGADDHAIAPLDIVFRASARSADPGPASAFVVGALGGRPRAT